MPSGSSLDWNKIDRALIHISAAAKGERGWPPLALARARLRATRHDLSDVRLAEVLGDRASFRRFCGFASQDPTPGRTTFVRFRRGLAKRGLDRVLFEAVTRQLDGRGVVVRTGTLVDATLIPSASIRHDSEAKWAGHRRRKPVLGHKAHIATDREAGLIRGVEVTTANVHGAAEPRGHPAEHPLPYLWRQRLPGQPAGADATDEPGIGMSNRLIRTPSATPPANFPNTASATLPRTGVITAARNLVALAGLALTVSTPTLRPPGLAWHGLAEGLPDIGTVLARSNAMAGFPTMPEGVLALEAAIREGFAA